MTFTRWLFRRSLVVDGNFSAEHLKMRKAETDVRLVNGEGYMVEEGNYQCHLSEGANVSQVSVHQTKLNLGSSNPEIKLL